MEKNAIKESRQAAGLTIKRMSELLEIPTRTIEAWEAGDRKPPVYVERLVLKELNSLKKD
jgi:DNA-binding transcriptional regulator YiaG